MIHINSAVFQNAFEEEDTMPMFDGSLNMYRCGKCQSVVGIGDGYCERCKTRLDWNTSLNYSNRQE